MRCCQKRETFAEQPSVGIEMHIPEIRRTHNSTANQCPPVHGREDVEDYLGWHDRLRIVHFWPATPEQVVGYVVVHSEVRRMNA